MPRPTLISPLLAALISVCVVSFVGVTGSDAAPADEGTSYAEGEELPEDEELYEDEEDYLEEQPYADEELVDESDDDVWEVYEDAPAPTEDDAPVDDRVALKRGDDTERESALASHGEWVASPGLWPSVAPDGRRHGVAPLYPRSMGVPVRRLDLAVRLSVGLGGLPLRSLGARPRLRMDLGAGQRVGARVGRLDVFGRVHRMGAASAICRGRPRMGGDGSGPVVVLHSPPLLPPSAFPAPGGVGSPESVPGSGEPSATDGRTGSPPASGSRSTRRWG